MGLSARVHILGLISFKLGIYTYPLHKILLKVLRYLLEASSWEAYGSCVSHYNPLKTLRFRIGFERLLARRL